MKRNCGCTCTTTGSKEQRTYDDPVLELAMRLDGGPEGVLELAEVTNEDAELVLAAIDETEAEMAGSDLVSRLRATGHTL